MRSPSVRASMAAILAVLLLAPLPGAGQQPRRGGALFHRGREMTSDAVRASLERWGRVNVRGRVVFDNVEGIATPDPQTVVVRLKEPDALFVSEIGSDHPPAAGYPKEAIHEEAPGPPRR